MGVRGAAGAKWFGVLTAAAFRAAVGAPPVAPLYVDAVEAVKTGRAGILARTAHITITPLPADTRGGIPTRDGVALERAATAVLYIAGSERCAAFPQPFLPGQDANHAAHQRVADGALRARAVIPTGACRVGDASHRLAAVLRISNNQGAAFAVAAHHGTRPQSSANQGALCLK